MNNLKKFILIASLLFTSTAPIYAESFNYEKDCADGKCLPELVKEAEELTKKARSENCLPNEGSTAEQIDKFYEGKEISEKCLGLLQAVKIVNDKIILVQSILEGNVVPGTLQCRPDGNPSPEVQPTLLQLAEHTDNQCTKEKEEKITASCSDDAMCALGASATGLAGPVLKYFNLDKSIKKMLPKNCDVTDDNCIAQFVTGFLDAAINFFVGVGDLIKMGWKALWGLEDKTSNNQLALAKASEEPGVFSSLVNDFPGSMKKLWGGLTTLIKEWMKTDVFCQKWEGTPHLSKCTEPMNDFGCITCKSLFRGMCSVAGNIIAEIVPSFITGGAVSVIKHGANAAVKLAKTLKVSDKLRKAVALTKLDKLAKVATVAGKWSLSSARLVGTKYLNSSVHKTTMLALSRLGRMMDNGATRLVIGAGKTTVVTSGKAVALTFKTVMVPFDNRLTRKAFELGMKAGDLPFAMASSKVVGGVRVLGLSGEARVAMEHVDDVGKEMMVLESKLSAPRPINPTPAEMQSLVDDAAKYQKVRSEYLLRVTEKRAAVLDDIFSKNPKKIKIDVLIDDLYPDLKYDQEFVKALQRSKVADAEDDLLARIKAIEDAPTKERLLMEFNDWRSKPSRAALKLDQRRFFHTGEILKNADLSAEDRFLEALRLTGRKAQDMKPEEVQKLRTGLLKAHQVGEQRGAKVFSYSSDEIREKARILKEAGYKTDEIDSLMRSGLAGRGFREIIPARGVAFEAARVIKPEEFKAFEQLHKGNLDELLKSNKITKDMIKEENLIWAHAPKDDVRYIVMKDPDNILDSYVFSLEKSRWNPFDKPKVMRLRDMPKDFGDVIRLSDGKAVKFVNRDADKVGKAREFNVFDDVADSSYKTYLNNLVAATEDAPFKQFLTSNSDEIERLLKTGRYTVNDLKPENILRLKSMNGTEELTLLRSFEKGGDVQVFGHGKQSSSLFEHFKKFEKPQFYETADGNLVRVVKNDFTAYIDQVAPKMSKVEAESALLAFRSQVSKNVDTKVVDKLFNESADQFLFDLRSGYLNVDDLANTQLTLSPLKKGDQALVLWRKTPKGDQFEYIRISKKGDLLERGELANIYDEIGDSIKFSSRDEFRKWKFGNEVFFDSARNTGEKISDFVDSLVKKYSIRDAKGELYFEDYVNFLKKHRENIVAFEGKGVFPDISLKNFAKSVTKDGDEIFLGIKNKIKDDMIVFTKDGPKKIVDVLENGELALTDGRLLKRGADGNYFVTVTDESLKTAAAKTAVSNMRYGIENRVHVFNAQYLNPKGMKLDDAMRIKLMKSIEESLQYGAIRGANAFQYDAQELRKIIKIFDANGVPREYTDYIIRSGLAARPPTNVLSVVNDARGPFSSVSFDDKKKILFSNLSGENAIKLRSNPSNVVKRTAAEVQTIKDNIDGMYFIDYQHHSDNLYLAAKGEKKLSDFQLYTRYNSNGDKAFENYKTTMDWLRRENPPLDTRTMKKIHVRMMEGGVENLKDDYMGVVRPYDVYGNAGSGLSLEAVENIRNNHYLSFVQTGTTSSGFPKGQIWYPNVEVVSDKTLSLIRKSNPDIVEYIEARRLMEGRLTSIADDIVKARAEGSQIEALISSNSKRLEELKKMTPTKSVLEEMEAVSSNLDAYKLQLQKFPDELAQKIQKLQVEQSGITQKLTESKAIQTQMQQKLLDALTDEALARFNSKRAALGVIDNPEKFDQYVDMLAELQRDMVSIHPLGNGNGRTTRQFALYYPLMKEGFPPPRILDTNNDIYKPLSAWSKELKDGIRNSQQLVEDLETRSRLGLKLEESPYLISPKSPPETIELNYKIQGKKDALTQVEKVDPELFHQYRMQVLDSDPQLAQFVKEGRDPSSTWNKIDEKASELYKRDNIYFDHQKKGLERLGLGPVSKEFKDVYGRPVANDPVLYQRKMDQFFDDQLVWRGLASKNYVQTEEELVSFFRQTNNHMASNSILGKRLSTADDIRKAGLDDLEKYRKAIETDGDAGIVRMAKDHSETGPLYGQSWGYSTSKDRKVGKAFAQGAMVVAPYGQHQKFQHLLKQRVLVGGMKAKTDVDLSRLKNLRNEFSYKYPRQQEVMGVGAMDPDAIKVVQTLDEAGKASKTYLRNPDKPYEILVIKGEVNPGDKIPRDLIEKVIDLRN